MYRLFDAVDDWLVDLSTRGCPHRARRRALVPADDPPAAAAPRPQPCGGAGDAARHLPQHRDRRHTGLPRLHADDASRIDGRAHRLDGLDSEAIAQLVDQTPHGNESPETVSRLASLIAEQTAGNSYFASELVTALTSDSIESPSAGRSPSRCRTSLLTRVDRLSKAAIDLLEIAAVAGAEFRLDVVAHAAGASASDVGGLLTEALGDRLLQEVPGPATTFRFQHDLVRSTLELRLPAHRRTALHRRLAHCVHRDDRRRGARPDGLSHLAAPTSRRT